MKGRLLVFSQLAAMMLASPSFADILPANGWNFDVDHGVIYFVTTDGQAFVLADGPVSGGSAAGEYGSLTQTRNLAVGQYSLTYLSTGSPATPSSNSENLVPSIGGAGNGVRIAYPSSGITNLFASAFNSYTDNFTISKSGPAAIAFTFSSEGCTQYCGIGFDFGDVELKLLSLSPIAGLLPGNIPTNAAHVAKAIDPFTANLGTFPISFVSLYSLSQADMIKGLGQLSSETGNGIQQSGLDATDLFMGTVFDNAFGSTDSTAGGKQASHARMPWKVWAAPYGGGNNIAGNMNTGASAFAGTNYGVAVGANYYSSPTTQFGFALGGARSNFNLADNAGNGKADMFNAAIDARRNWGSTYLSGGLGYSWEAASSERTLTFLGIDRLQASLHPQILTARIEAGHRFAMANSGLTPFAASQSSVLFMPAYAETQISGTDAFALNYAANTSTANHSELGIRWDKTGAMANGSSKLTASLAWIHEWNPARAVNAGFVSLPGSTFEIDGASPSADAVRVSLGSEVTYTNGWSTSAKLGGEFSSNQQSYEGKFGFGYKW